MTSSTRGKWSAVGSIVSAPVRGYYYPGRVKAIKRSVDVSSTALYSVVFSDPLGSIDESDDQGLILDFTADQLIGRGFEPITRALLSENQKVFITHRGREVSARVVKHEEEDDMLRLRLDAAADSQEMSVKLHEVRLLPSRKSGRLQEHPDYSLLASGRRSPVEEEATKAKQGGRRRTTSSSSNSLLISESFASQSKDPSSGPVHMVSAHIDVPQQSGRKRRTSNPDVMDECTAALVLMSLSASPRSPTFLTERFSLYKCTWPGCVHETFKCSEIEKHVRQEHLNKFERGTGEEEFYYTEVDLRHKDSSHQPFSPASMNNSSGPDSPISLSEDAASTSSSTSAVMTGDNSMDSNPPSPDNSNFFKPNSAFVPVPQYRHLEDHEYNRRPDPAGISILGSGSARRGKKGANSFSVSDASPSHPINIPSMDSDSQPMMSSSFGGFSGASSLSSGFGSYNSFGSSFTPLSPPQSSGSLSSSLSSGSNKYLRIGAGRGTSGTTLLQNGVAGINRTSPTKRVRGESRKCRKVYGMEKKDAWCTQCKWKKACTRFLD